MAFMLVLQLQHHLRKSLGCDLILFLFFPALTDLVILAVHTFQVTIAKKDVPDSVGTYERRLFSEMGTIRRNDRFASGVTARDLIVCSIDLAIERANVAGRKALEENVAPFLNLSGLVELQISRCV